MSMPTVGQWVEISQPGGHWLPFLVTHVYDADTVSGVAFSGQPNQVGWHRPVADFAHVTRGESNRQWREAGAEEAPAADDLTVIPRLGDKAAEWLAGYGVDSFAELATLPDTHILDLAAADDIPGGVSESRLREWREAAATRIG